MKACIAPSAAMGDLTALVSKPGVHRILTLTALCEQLRSVFVLGKEARR